jgi:hypothetical protein
MMWDVTSAVASYFYYTALLARRQIHHKSRTHEIFPASSSTITPNLIEMDLTVCMCVCKQHINASALYIQTDTERWSGRGLTEVLPPSFPWQGLWKTTKTVGQDDRCSDRESNWSPPEFESTLLPSARSRHMWILNWIHNLNYIWPFHLFYNLTVLGTRFPNYYAKITPK